MSDPLQPVKNFEVGPYSDLAARPNPEGLRLVFIPSLASILVAAEKKQGTLLTKAEVESTRDRSTVVASPIGPLDDSRGYKDIDPSRCWDEWLSVRAEVASIGPNSH